MCHIVLLLPVIGLGLFWILPLPVALPLYIVILITSAVLYMSLMKIMKLPVKTGKKGLLGSEGEVVRISGGVNQISVHGELWSAVSNSQLHKGETVKIVGIDGLTLIVDELNPGQINNR